MPKKQRKQQKAAAKKKKQAESGACLLLELFDDPMLVAISSWLDSKMLGRLACAHPRFNDKTVPDAPAAGGRRQARATVKLCSVVNAAARLAVLRFRAQPPPTERLLGVRVEWLHVLAHIEVISRPLEFTSATGNLDLEEDTATVPFGGQRRSPGTAVCGDVIMRSGVGTGLFRAEFSIDKLSDGANENPGTGNYSMDCLRQSPLMTVGIVEAQSPFRDVDRRTRAELGQLSVEELQEELRQHQYEGNLSVAKRTLTTRLLEIVKRERPTGWVNTTAPKRLLTGLCSHRWRCCVPGERD